MLSLLTEKMQLDLDDIEKLLNSVTQLDVINARATYSLSFGGTCPDLFLLEDESSSLTTEAHLSRLKTPKASHPAKREWTLYLPKAYHPLLLQQHRQNLQKARKDVSQAKFEIRRKLQEGNMTRKGESDTDISTLQMQVTELEQAHPVPVDFFISRKTRVLVITGPNTGGKTICLKTVGLAAIMAKSGLYVLSSESVQIPWFDSVFADIGDEQSLSQSLSTFSGHLKQISEIQSQLTSQSLVLLDEVGAGTNPLEGAALGMSVLEFFAETGASLTLATTHHGELKTLKYSNDAFENACMEFDEVNLKPTYKILWGVPGRSNAINIAERIGLPNIVVDNARELHGAASAEINEVIIDMERFKQDIQKHIYEAQHHLTLSRELREKLLVARREIMEHGSDQRYKKIRQISEAASIARSTLHKKVRQLRQSSSKATTAAIKTQQYTADVNSKHSTATKSVSPVQAVKPSLSGITNYISEEKGGLLKVGDMVHISSIGKKGTILRVEPSKQEILVQAGNMKLKLKFSDVRKA